MSAFNLTIKPSFAGLQNLTDMKYFLLFAFLGMVQLCHAQKLRRHEITVGYYGGYFFDETLFRLQNIGVNKRLPTVTYKFKIIKNININVFYGVHDLAGEKINGENIEDFPNTIIGRTVKHISLRGGYELYLRDININMHAGLSYRGGYKGEFIYAYDHGRWKEFYFEYYDYNNIGVLFEATIQHRIYYNFFGEFSVNYTRYFSSFDQNLLMLGYRIGFRL